jgi:hypothetical protein
MSQQLSNTGSVAKCEPPNPSCVAELAVLVHRMCLLMEEVAPGRELTASAQSYLERKGFITRTDARTSGEDAPDLQARAAMIPDLAMIARRLVFSLTKRSPGHNLMLEAKQFLAVNGLTGSVLRSTAHAL